MSHLIYDVKAFGAVADAETFDTLAIQSAIDACHQAGGGQVYLGPGVYLSSTLHLKSQVRLYLEAGAILKGSGDIADYQEIPRINPYHNIMPYWFLIYAANAENVSIEGRGTMEGRGQEFWMDEMVNDRVLKPNDNRPRALVCMFNCRDLLFRDVTMQNSPTYTLWLVGCDTINIDGVKISNPYNGPNTDAIDLDCCRNARVSNCHIEAGDDCIAIKSDTRLLNDLRPCENIVVTNCTLSSSTCAIRLGYEGDAPLRNCVFSNLSIYDSNIGIDVVSIIPAGTIYCSIVEGAVIEDIIFSDIVMRNVNQPIFVWLGNQTEKTMVGTIKNLAFRSVIAHGKKGSYIGGTAADSIKSVSLRDVKLIMEGHQEDPYLERPEVWGGEKIPFGLFFEHVEDLTLAGLSIDWTAASGVWEHQIRCENITDLEVTGFRSKGFETISAGQAVSLESTTWLETKVR